MARENVGISRAVAQNLLNVRPGIVGTIAVPGGSEPVIQEGRDFVSEFMDTQTGVFHEEAFRHLLTREAGRATRYQDFFSVCLLRPDIADDRRQMEEI